MVFIRRFLFRESEKTDIFRWRIAKARSGGGFLSTRSSVCRHHDRSQFVGLLQLCDRLLLFANNTFWNRFHSSISPDSIPVKVAGATRSFQNRHRSNRGSLLSPITLTSAIVCGIGSFDYVAENQGNHRDENRSIKISQNKILSGR
jgi:hypothetical protein